MSDLTDSLWYHWCFYLCDLRTNQSLTSFIVKFSRSIRSGFCNAPPSGTSVIHKQVNTYTQDGAGRNTQEHSQTEASFMLAYVHTQKRPFQASCVAVRIRPCVFYNPMVVRSSPPLGSSAGFIILPTVPLLLLWFLLPVTYQPSYWKLTPWFTVVVLRLCRRNRPYGVVEFIIFFDHLLTSWQFSSE